MIDRLSADLRRDFPDMTGLLPETLSTCARSQKRIPSAHSCNKLLHDCRGATSSGQGAVDLRLTAESVLVLSLEQGL